MILGGNSRVFKDWAARSTITADEFLENLEWVCNDPLDEKGRMTRDIGLTPTGIVKLQRVYDAHGLVSFYLGKERWDGAFFERPAIENERPLYGDIIREHQKIGLSCKDRV